MKRLERVVAAPPDLGSEIIGVVSGTDVTIRLSLESVMEGVYVSGTADAEASGECVRCLDPVTTAVHAPVQELYLYDPPEAGDEDALDETALVHGDYLDLEPALRDAVVTALPFQPVCQPDCLGLCARCGMRMAEDPTHTHTETDPRWAALNSLTISPDQH